MKCDECLTLLDQYVEEEVQHQTARFLAAHMATCSECSHAYEMLRREQQVYASYLLEVEPPPALWAKLRLEMANEKVIKASQPQLQRWIATVLGPLRITPQLATALVLIIAGLAIGIPMWRASIDASRHSAPNPGLGAPPPSEVNRAGALRDSDDSDPRRSVIDKNRHFLPASPGSADRRRQVQVSTGGRTARRVIVKAPDGHTVDEVTRNAELEYLSAIQTLSRDIKRHQAAVSPRLLSQLESALAEVDRNIAATRRVAREHPRDPFAVQYLAVAYEKKIELLREVTNW